jgi:hypothetical protein
LKSETESKLAELKQDAEMMRESQVRGEKVRIAELQKLAEREKAYALEDAKKAF